MRTTTPHRSVTLLLSVTPLHVFFAALLVAKLTIAESIVGQQGPPLQCVEWSPYSDNPAPAPRISMAMAYDSVRGKIVMYGGYGDSSTHLDDTWEWDGEWQKLNVLGTGPRSHSAMAFDSRREVCVMFGGIKEGSPPETYLGDTWEWNGDQWALRAKEGPSPRSSHTMCYDQARGVVVLFGGHVQDFGNTLSNETWEWDGRQWSLRTTTGPSPRLGACMAFDSKRNVSVLFGGRENYHDVRDTWEWNGVEWRLKSTDGPDRRAWHALSFDSENHLTVLYGGRQNAPYTIYSSIWVWDGTVWVQRRQYGPSKRVSHAMAFDMKRGLTIVFGGYDSFGYQDDTRALDVSPPLLSGDTNCDRIVDTYDLLYIIYAWDWCPVYPDSCFGDVAPAPNGDGVVNTLDLLMVINNWGP